MNHFRITDPDRKMTLDAKLAIAILDSLPVHACVVDCNGIVQYVNQSWRNFVTNCGCPSESVLEGMDYPATCEQVSGPRADAARTFATGLREVLTGLRDSFALEYAYHGVNSKLWFEVRANRMEKCGDLFVITRSDITELRNSNENHQRFRVALEAIADAILIVDCERNRLVDVNEAACRIYGYSRSEILETSPAALFSVASDTLRQSWQILIEGDVEEDTHDTRLQRADGSWLPVEVQRRAVRVGDTWLIVKVIRDMTARQAIEATRQRQATQQALLAGFGQFALENPSLQELVSHAAEVVRKGLNVELCRILESTADENTLVQVAGSGWQESWLCVPYFDAGAETEDRFIVGARESIFISDFETETRFLASPILRAHGIRSAVEVLIWGAGEPYGVIGAYHREPNRFNADSANFVQSVSNTLAAAIDRRNAEEQLSHMAQFDSLTGLPNRSLFLDRLGQTLIEADRSKLTVGVMFIDVDRFKNVNDSLGHAAGDHLLTRIAERLNANIRPGDTISRLSGDEFALSLAHMAREDDAAIVAQKILLALESPFEVHGSSVYVSVSVGISLYPYDGEDPDVLLINADTAMYRAKESGRNGYRFFTAKMNEHIFTRLRNESELRGALGRGDYRVYYQPKINLETHAISGMEALLRWNAPSRGFVSPEEFVPLLEESGLIVPVGKWVIETVCKQIRDWRDQGINPRPVAINLSACQFRQADLDVSVCDIIEASGIESNLLEFELTESTLMRDSNAAVETLNRMKARGIKLSIDDFGTGYSSLSYLKRFPLDALKIDRTFINHVTTDPDDQALALAIIKLAHSLQLKVVAEGVENEAQLEFLLEHDCDEIQGFYFSRPLPAEEITDMLREDRHLERPVKPNR